VTPDKTQTTRGYEGWAYCAHTPENDIFMVYFEKGCVRSQIRAVRPLSVYAAQWFEPRSGTWRNAGDGWLRSDAIGVIILPDFPDDGDRGLRLVYAGPAQSVRSLQRAGRPVPIGEE
jgi:hypothetical protein